MTAEATIARANAVNFEAKKDGCTQRQSGDWVIRLTVQAADLPQSVMRAAPGTRYVVALVQVDDNEQPVRIARDTEAASPAPRQDSPPVPHSAGAPTYAQRLGIACGKPAFWKFLKSRLPQSACIQVTNEDEAAVAVRFLLNVKSRTETAVGTEAGERARKMLGDFDNWYRGEAA